jgi:CRISPR system Cascade subunit CasC
MTRFIQLHLLTFYPPANLNRDDTGRPKSATVGGVPRLRISSQALKRAWRTSDLFKDQLDGHLGDRTQRIGRNVLLELLRNHQIDRDVANGIARVVASVFGKLDVQPKPEQELFIKQLAFISPTETHKLNAFLARALADEELRSRLLNAAGEVTLDVEGNEDSTEVASEERNGRKGKAKQSKATTKLIAEMRSEILTAADTAADIAMFGRMLADSPNFNREAAVQVAHAITTHRVTVEDDYYTAVDDLKTAEEDAGAGFVGELGFGSGVFYLYACVDTGLLGRNLGGDGDLAGTACAALAEAAATVSPRGKQPSFAARARAHYVLAERGDAQPRTLAGAFLKPVEGADLGAASIAAMLDWRDKLDRAYGPAAEETRAMDVMAGKGTLAELVEFCRVAATAGAGDA